MPTDPAVQAAIVRAAREAGVNPAFALAVAERESSFDPRARSSKTIRGAFQMRGDLREQYGVSDSDDPYAQAKGWSGFIGDVKGQMAKRLGRDVTDQEAYLGHHFGAGRAARAISMDPSTPVTELFTPNEMAINPHFAKAGTVGNLNKSITDDMTRRMARYGGASDDAPDFASYGTPVSMRPDNSARPQMTSPSDSRMPVYPPDVVEQLNQGSKLGKPWPDFPNHQLPNDQQMEMHPNSLPGMSPEAPDLSPFGDLAGERQAARSTSSAPDFSAYGDPV